MKFLQSDEEEAHMAREISKMIETLLYSILKDSKIPWIVSLNSFLHPTINLKHSSEACNKTNRNKSKVQAAEMQGLRLIRDMTLQKHIKNKEMNQSWE